MKIKSFYSSVLLSVVFLCWTELAANAYIGPGAAITLLGSILGFSWLVFLGIIFTFAWPLVYIQTNKK